MSWFHRLRIHLLPMTSAQAQKRVDVLDHALADLRAEIAALPEHERATHTHAVQLLIAEQAHARNVLSDVLDNRSER